jgi:hypothetical protein
MRDRLKFGGSYSILTIQSRGGKKKGFKKGTFLKVHTLPRLAYALRCRGY